MNFLNISNADRLSRYPSGKCPVCDGQKYEAYFQVDVDEGFEMGLVCTGCDEKYPIDEPICSISQQTTYPH